MSDPVQLVGDKAAVDPVVPIHKSSPVQTSASAAGSSIPGDQSLVQQPQRDDAVSSVDNVTQASSSLSDDQSSAQQQAQTNVPVTVLPAGHKEQEPIPNADAVESDDLLQPSEKEPSLHPEVQEAGVEAVSHTPELTLEDKKAGLQLANEAVPVLTQPTGVVQLSVSEDQVKSGMKSHKSVWDSFTWMLIEFRRHYQRMHRRMINK